MSFARNLAIQNLKGKPGRTAALALLAAFLSFSIFGGSIIVLSLQNGLRSYEARLGADIVAVPYEATTKGTFESILLQGIPGYFYMDTAYLDKIRGIEGVEAASPQFYLASAKAGCCSVAVQVIGFDPDTDFTIQPWIRESYAGGFGDGDLLVGSNISIPASGTLTFYNLPCHVAAQLDATGTGLDNAVYANMNTIRAMMEGSRAAGFRYLEKANLTADRAISSVMIKVADGYDIDAVTGDINVHVRHIEATQAKSMISDIAGGLGSVSRVIGLLTVMIWILAIAILIVAFVMISNERKKEFAVLRVMGASRKLLSRLLLTEAAAVSLLGAALGAAAAALVVFPFGNLIRARLDLPYLLPGAGTVIALLLGAVAVSVLAGSLTAAVSARNISRSDAGLILREDG